MRAEKINTQETLFENSLQHLQEELKRIDLLISRQIQNFRRQGSKDIPKEYKGLFISEGEIDEILHKNKNQEKENKSPGSQENDYDFNSHLQALNSHITQKTTATLEKGTYLSLVHLAQLFRLTPFDIDCILITLAPELDLKYERLYAYLQNDITKKRPTVDLVLKLLGLSLEEKTALRPFFSTHALLFRNNLLNYTNEPGENRSPLLSRSLKLDDRIVDFLLEIQDTDPRVTPFANIIAPRVNADDLVIPGDTREKINHLVRMFSGKENDKDSVVWLKGPGNNGQLLAAQALCQQFGLYLLIVDMEAMDAANPPFDFDILLKLVMRESVLHSCAPYFQGCDQLLENREKNSYKKQFLAALKQFNGIVFIEGKANWRTEFENFRDLHHHFFILDFPVPPYTMRKKLWQVHLNGIPVQEDIDIPAIANKFRFTGGQIREAVQSARDTALLKKSNETWKISLSKQDLYNACRAGSNQKLTSLSRKIEPRYTWDDIILPKENFKHLKEISSYVKYKHVVYEDWGFDKKLSLGKGLNALFHGSSGTGKTMAAEVIANDLGLDLYKIDLSNVVSKYIGETEKNLNKIFKEAETSNSILFFDEADALFGKRSEVRDSHDRYANIEVAYLLQKMEEYEGIVFLATNLLKNIDDAFVRRMHFSLEFPFPDEAHRLKIWRTIFPNEAPRDEGIDFEFLAKKFKIPGGNIKNIILTAAFFAAENSRKIGMQHMIIASKREFQKIGKLCIQSDFGKYYDLTLEN